jgi:hypothetical protein
MSMVTGGRWARQAVGHSWVSGVRSSRRREGPPTARPHRTPGNGPRVRQRVRRCCTQRSVGLPASVFGRPGTRRRCARRVAGAASVQPAESPRLAVLVDAGGVDMPAVGRLVCNNAAAVCSTKRHRPGTRVTKVACVMVRVMAQRSCAGSSSSGAPPRDASLSLSR